MKWKLGLLALILLVLGVSAYLAVGCSTQTVRPTPEPVARRVEAPSSVPSQAGMELRVGHWNVRDFSAKSRSPEALKEIAEVARSFDCLAVCELNDDVVLGKLATEEDALGGQWAEVQTDQKVGNTPGSSEYYGFLYRSDRLKVRAPPRTLPKVDCPVPGEEPHRFDRDPAVCSFATLDGRLDFTMIEVHVTWGEKVEYRRAEVRALKGYFERVRDSDPGDKDVILCGDFNRDVGDKGSLSVLLTEPDMTDTTAPDVPTMVASDHTYDHLLFQTRFLTEYTGRHGVERFDETMFGNDDAKAKKDCSDHRPVWVVLRVPKQDDD